MFGHKKKMDLLASKKKWLKIVSILALSGAIASVFSACGNDKPEIEVSSSVSNTKETETTTAVTTTTAKSTSTSVTTTSTKETTTTTKKEENETEAEVEENNDSPANVEVDVPQNVDNGGASNPSNGNTGNGGNSGGSKPQNTQVETKPEAPATEAPAPKPTEPAPQPTEPAYQCGEGCNYFGHIYCRAGNEGYPEWYGATEKSRYKWAYNECLNCGIDPSTGASTYVANVSVWGEDRVMIGDPTYGDAYNAVWTLIDPENDIWTA